MFRPTPVRFFVTTRLTRHENPLVAKLMETRNVSSLKGFFLCQGLPRKPRPPPQIPRRGGPIERRPIANVKKVVAVASGKGGVGKSTIAGMQSFRIRDTLIKWAVQ